MKDNKEMIALTQLVIGVDILINKYSKLNIKQKIELIKRLESLKDK